MTRIGPDGYPRPRPAVQSERFGMEKDKLMRFIHDAETYASMVNETLSDMRMALSTPEEEEELTTFKNHAATVLRGWLVTIGAAEDATIHAFNLVDWEGVRT